MEQLASSSIAETMQPNIAQNRSLRSLGRAASDTPFSSTLAVMYPRIVGLLALLAFSSASLAASICRPGEDSYFFCSFSRKTAALCASTDKSTGVKLLQYRISKGGRVEMQYPNEPQRPEGKFAQSSVLLAHGGEKRVSFQQGEYKYVLYETWDTHSPSYGGIYVLRNGKRLQQYQCDDYTNYKASLFESMPRNLLSEEEYVDF